ncbi:MULTISPECIES: AAA family ATPase [Streptosporangium]|uniref:Kinase n=1 Tax=Streptosporangium brasiliense TaxID=47480 RepID=A0ABT9R4F2_9ACTN|nr:AAA family ATPase [Streptosporangium brasiliense]MDP9864106.1 putative kinase [Streptosporangium brasiliense]
MLIVMSGLPGVGKSSIAQELGRLLPAPVLSVDPVEAAMWRAGVGRGQPTGLAAYVVVEALASDVLALGQTVIVDAVNDAEEAREQWRALARRRGVALRYIEVVCPDRALHRRRLEARQRDIDGFAEPTWASVDARRANFDAWREERLILDSTAPLADNARVAMAHLGDAR